MKINAIIPIILLMSCGEDSKDIVASFNTPPSLRIEEPLEGIGVAQYDEVLFVVYVEDSQDEPESLTVTWSSDIQSDFFGPENSDEDGYILYPTTSLVGGYHTILITVTDAEGLTAAASVQVEVEELAAIQLVSPEDDEYGRFDEESNFSVIVRDGVDNIEALQIDFSTTHASILGSFCTPIIDTDTNTASCSVALPEGLHNLTFSSTNSREETVSVSREFQVYSPFQIDDDNDGFCEVPPCINAEGAEPDCDDTNNDIAPDEEEIYNQIDDNCNELIDEGDDDGDGYNEAEGDCDDGKDFVYPTAPELENGIDDDCDGVEDEGTNAFDDDGDLQSENQGDCNDAVATIYLGATESANGVDDDCDGMIDEGTVVYDDDGDGYCESPPCIGSLTSLQADSSSRIDCNDSNNMIYGGATETANSIDDDCDGLTDEGTTNYDDDGDGQSEVQGDCDDSVATTYQNAPELINGIDDNCNTLIDDGTDAYDDDGDGQTENDGDCDDNNISIYLGSSEVPNDLDDDCDGTIDEGTVNYDDDGDGFSENDGDCDDNNNLRSPGKVETCSTAFDDDCDSDTNDLGASGCSFYYYDVDNDGYGVTGDYQCTCDPQGYYTGDDDGDCHDGNADVFPNQTDYFYYSYQKENSNSYSHDYNCDESSSLEYSSLGVCDWGVNSESDCSNNTSYGVCGMAQSGWYGNSLPSCGSAYSYIESDCDCSADAVWGWPPFECNQDAGNYKEVKCR
jgi:hypothetical protein